MRRYISRIVYVLSVVMAASCLEPYDPPKIDGGKSYLVVDAFFNTIGPQVIDVTLSYTIPLGSSESPKKEEFASVQLRSDQGDEIPLWNVGSGRYYLSGSFANPGARYQLHILIAGTREYQSDYVKVTQAPEIDSVSFFVEGDVLDINVNTHDPENESRYYRWTFIETWEYRSQLSSGWVLQHPSPRQRRLDENIYTCWRTDTLKKIMVGTTSHLTEDIVSNFNLRKIERGSIELSRKYSILVRQQVLTPEAYDYWLSVQKASEQLGGLFDPQPGQIIGNIRSTRDTDEMVIGFFSAGSLTEKRIYIKPDDLPPHFADFRGEVCAVDTILLEDLHKLSDPDALANGVYSTVGFPVLLGFTTADQSCIDCRDLAHGETYKPWFWED